MGMVKRNCDRLDNSSVNIHSHFCHPLRWSVHSCSSKSRLSHTLAFINAIQADMMWIKDLLHSYNLLALLWLPWEDLAPGSGWSFSLGHAVIHVEQCEHNLHPRTKPTVTASWSRIAPEKFIGHEQREQVTVVKFWEFLYSITVTTAD